MHVRSTLTSRQLAIAVTASLPMLGMGTAVAQEGRAGQEGAAARRQDHRPGGQQTGDHLGLPVPEERLPVPREHLGDGHVRRRLDLGIGVEEGHTQARGERAAHGLALRGDGTVAAWGDDSFGQASVPAGLSGVEAVQAGEFWSAARRQGGEVVVWGRDGDVDPESIDWAPQQAGGLRATPDG